MTLSTGDGVDLAFSVLGGPRRVSDSLCKVWAADRKLTPRAPSLLTLRDQVIAPVPRRHPQPTDGSKTQGLDQHRPPLRTDPRHTQTPFDDLALTTPAPLAT